MFLNPAGPRGIHAILSRCQDECGTLKPVYTGKEEERGNKESIERRRKLKTRNEDEKGRKKGKKEEVKERLEGKKEEGKKRRKRKERKKERRKRKK